MNAELRNSHHFEHAGARLQNIIRRNRSSDAVGVYAVCSAHPAGIAAVAHEGNAKDSILHVESTSSQVNQFGGYTGQNPEQFASFVPAVAAELIGTLTPPLTLISQYLPVEYEAIRGGRLQASPSEMVRHHIQAVLHKYAVACGEGNIKR